jgi:hypothetical protein
MNRFRLDLSPSQRLLLLLLLYSAVLSASLWMAYDLRFDFLVSPADYQERYFVLLWLLPLQLILLGILHQLRPLLDYFSTPDLGRMVHALFLSSVITELTGDRKHPASLAASRRAGDRCRWQHRQ